MGTITKTSRTHFLFLLDQVTLQRLLELLHSLASLVRNRRHGGMVVEVGLPLTAGFPARARTSKAVGGQMRVCHTSVIRMYNGHFEDGLKPEY